MSINWKSALIGAVLLYAVQRFAAPRVPALNVLKP